MKVIGIKHFGASDMTCEICVDEKLYELLGISNFISVSVVDYKFVMYTPFHLYIPRGMHNRPLSVQIHNFSVFKTLIDSINFEYAAMFWYLYGPGKCVVMTNENGMHNTTVHYSVIQNALNATLPDIRYDNILTFQANNEKSMIKFIEKFIAE